MHGFLFLESLTKLRAFQIREKGVHRPTLMYSNRARLPRHSPRQIVVNPDQRNQIVIKNTVWIRSAIF